MTVDDFVKHARAFGYFVIDRQNEEFVIARRESVNLKTAKVPLSISILNGKPSDDLVNFLKETQEVEKVANEVRNH
jgi:hypothetical protein